MDALTRLPDHEAIAVLEELGSNDLSLVRNLPAYSTAQRSTSHAGLHHITSHAGLHHRCATCRPTSWASANGTRTSAGCSGCRRYKDKSRL